MVLIRIKVSGSVYEITVCRTSPYTMFSVSYSSAKVGGQRGWEHCDGKIDKNGDVCISILHEPGEDKYGYEKPEERWLPIHTVETIMISVISMLADPNGDSPANVDAAELNVMSFDSPVIFCSGSLCPALCLADKTGVSPIEKHGTVFPALYPPIAGLLL
ncbi:hypothetical protein GH733_018581 [Mirounga leonina]|nr:hypothetical protein GH733_018581 [Mirounga leonina]